MCTAYGGNAIGLIALAFKLQLKYLGCHPTQLRWIVWLYGQADFNRAKALIRETDWDNILSGTVDQCVQLWTQT